MRPSHASRFTGLAKVQVNPRLGMEQLREDHCAVDPKKIPYGSKVIFGDSECTAIDTGPDVVKRKAARSLDRTTAERNAIVVDRFFDTRQRALTWENAHPHFTMVRVQTRD